MFSSLRLKHELETLMRSRNSAFFRLQKPPGRRSGIYGKIFYRLITEEHSHEFSVNWTDGLATTNLRGPTAHEADQLILD